MKDKKRKFKNTEEKKEYLNFLKEFMKSLNDEINRLKKEIYEEEKKELIN